MNAVKGNPALTVVFASDRYYVLPLMVAMYSLYKSQNEGTEIQIYVIETGDIPDYCKGIMETMAGRFGMPAPIYIAPKSDYENLDIHIAHTTQATYYRLDLPDLLPQTDICLYLDCDLLVTSDILSLFSIDMSDSLLAGVKAAAYYHPVEGQANKANLLGIDALDQYVNAGVLLMNLELMRERGLTERFRSLIEKNFNSQDQDILNAACYGSIRIMGPSFNLMSKYHPNSPGSFKDDPCIALAWTKEEWEDAVAHPVIVHYADDVKPWNSFESDGSERWWNVVVEMEEQGFLPRLQECLFPEMGTCDSLRIQVKDASAKVAEFKEAYCAMRRAYATVKDEHTRLKEKTKTFDATIDELFRRNLELESTIEAMRSSRTWKAGRVLTAPFRPIRRLFISDENSA